jgi:hypothetical protein
VRERERGVWVCGKGVVKERKCDRVVHIDIPNH